ncbi:DNA-binding NarL/FixJ family response regulator [Bradyrhizobium yuanmingense]
MLNVSENTVNFHVKNAMRKLETSSRTKCVVKARRQGII